MNIKVFNVCLLLGWLMVLAGGVLINLGWGIAIAGVLLIMLSFAASYVAGLYSAASAPAADSGV